jgi:PAS domain S-box/diguanylate cyclase (GGDEF) domain
MSNGTETTRGLHFLSLKWKALILTSVVLVAIVVSFSALNHYTLLRQFEQQQHLVHRSYDREVYGLIDRSLERLQQVAALIPKLKGMREALLSGDRARIKAFFDEHWVDLQLHMGLDVVRFYDTQTHLLAAWGRTVLGESDRDRPTTPWIHKANLREQPITRLDCRDECMQYAAVPMLVDGQTIGVVLLGSSLVDIVLSFKQISGADVGLLVTNRDASLTGYTDKTIPAWQARVMALTNLARNLPLLQEVSERYPRMETLAQDVHKRFEGRDYEIMLIPFQRFTTSAAKSHLVVIADISQPLANIEAATRQNLIMGSGGLLLSEVLLLALLWTPIDRLRRTAHNLPLLGKGAFEEVRSAIHERARRHPLRDEIDVLDATATTLSHQLEKLEHEVSDRTQALREHMAELAHERDFIKSLLDTAQVIILTQNSAREIKMLNQYGESLGGYHQEEVVARDFVELITADERLPDIPGRLREITEGRRDQLRHEGQLRCKDGSTREIAWLHSRLAGASAQDPVILSIGLDVTGQKQAEFQLSWLADHDPLTGLFNRRRFQAELQQTLASAQRYGQGGALLFFDLDHFKYVNETSGPHAGDLLLELVAKALSRVVRQVDVLGRLGGDEFAVLIRQTDSDGAIQAAKKINEHLGTLELSIEGHHYRVSASIGIALFPLHGTTPHELLAVADLAMYHTKEAGRGGWHLFSEEDQSRERLNAHVYWKERVEEALAADRFVLYYQPIRDLKSEVVTHYEALLRMVEPGGSLISPGVFVDACERTSLIYGIDHMVLRKAIAAVGELVAAGHDIRLSINLSARAFEDPEILPIVRGALTRSAVRPNRIIFEITETAAVADFTAARALIKAIRELGCRFALDDFGVGFASFYYLKQLPVDYVKIDGSFIRNLADDPDDQVLVKAMNGVAKGFGKKTIAEFVENADVLAILRAYGVDFAQGNYIGRPQAREQLFGRPSRITYSA